MAIKAKKLGSKKGFEKSLKGGGGKYALRVPPEGVVVRFLTEPEEWYEVEYHFDQDRQTSYPCVDGDCIGCEEGLDAKSRWFAVVYNVDDDRVTPFEMPKSVAKMLYKKYDRYNTITDRNYEVTKEGTGLNTEYDVEAMPAEHLRGQSKMEVPDLGDFLQGMYEEAMRQIEDGVETVSASGRSKSRRSKPRRRIELDEDEFDDDPMDDEEVIKKPRKVRTPSRTTSKTMKRRSTRR